MSQTIKLGSIQHKVLLHGHCSMECLYSTIASMANIELKSQASDHELDTDIALTDFEDGLIKLDDQAFTTTLTDDEIVIAIDSTINYLQISYKNWIEEYVKTKRDMILTEMHRLNEQNIDTRQIQECHTKEDEQRWNEQEGINEITQLRMHIKSRYEGSGLEVKFVCNKYIIV